MKEFYLKRCMKCGATVQIIDDCTCPGCGIQCCGEQMKELLPNSIDAAIEKHVPVYEVREGRISIKVNHVMEEDHYIEWISVIYEGKEETRYFKPGEAAEMECKYVKGSTIYAYCNKHGLWKKEVV